MSRYIYGSFSTSTEPRLDYHPNYNVETKPVHHTCETCCFCDTVTCHNCGEDVHVCTYEAVSDRESVVYPVDAQGACDDWLE